MRIRTMHVAAAVAGAVIAAGAGVAIAQEFPPNTTRDGAPQLNEDEDGTTIPRADSERAAQSALRAVGGGRLESVERESGGYEVEIQRSGGAEAEVFVDESFNVVGRERDDDRGNDDDRGDQNDEERDDD